MFTSRLERATGAEHSENICGKLKYQHFRELNNAVKCTLHIKHLLAKHINITQPLFKRVPIGLKNHT